MAIRKVSNSGLDGSIYKDASAKTSKIVDIPDTPTIGTATAGAESATITYTVANTGGIGTTFTALSNPGSITGTGSSPITVSGLTASTAYTFTVKAGNTTGDSAYSSASNSITALTGSAFDSIATVTLGSNASSATFSSIPSTYKHLQIRGTFIPTATDFSAVLRLNSDSAANYYAHTLSGNGSTASSDDVAAQGSYSNIRLLYSQDSTASTTPGSFIIDILDYQNTNKYKVTRTLSGIDTNSVAQQFVFLTSGLWKSTNAVNTVTIHSATGGYGKTLGSNFATNSKFALYGIKG